MPRAAEIGGEKTEQSERKMSGFPFSGEQDTMGRSGTRNQQGRGRDADAGRGRSRLRPTVMELEGRTLLSTWTVTKAGNDDGSTGTLSWAVGQVNAHPGTDTIAFSSLFDSAQTITLTGGQLTLSDKATTTITGPGANLLTINGNKKSRVLEISGGSAAVSGLTITKGTVNSGSGGGVWNNGGNLTLTDVVMSRNDDNDQRVGGGGGLANSGGTTTLTNCTLNNDYAGNAGGALYNNSGNTTLINCTVTGNQCGNGPGGGLYTKGSDRTLSLTNCTVTSNIAHYGGGGLFNDNTTVRLANCIIGGNLATPFKYNDIDGDYTNAGPNSIGSSAFLTGLGDYGGQTPTIALLPGSPAIGAGTTTGAPATDQRGLPRTGHVDLGAFQSQGFTLTPVAGSTPQAVLAGRAFASPLAVKVTANNPAEPVAGGFVNFAVTPAAGGASATLSAASATISGGQAAVTATANATTGWYTTAATLTGSAPADFVLANASLVVDTILDDADNADSVTSLRKAIGYANALPGADTITFDPSVFGTAPRTITLTHGELTLTDPATTTIDGPGAGPLTVSGNHASRVFHVLDGSAVLSDLTITGGSANLGGGLYNQAGTLALTDATVSRNTATFGGGLATGDNGTTTLTRATVSGNTANWNGGGIYHAGGSTTVADTAITGNTARNFGGGLCTNGGPSNGSLSLTNVTVAGNTSRHSFGGLAVRGGASLSLTNVTISGNIAVAPGGPGGLYIHRSAKATLTNTIVAGNSYPDAAGPFMGTNNLIGGDPLLAPLGDYGGPTQTMSLLPGSPAIGGGTAAGAPATDQRGVPRSGRVDIGAFQSEGFTLTPATGSTPQSTKVDATFAHPLAVIVKANNPAEPVDGGVISFKAPATGASATLSAASATITNGQAGVKATAGTTAGPYTVTASPGAGLPAAGFSLTNRPGAAASVAVASGSGQTAVVSKGFAAPLVVVVKDAFGNPVPGVSVAFAAPASGASATLTGSPAVTGADGLASVTATANATLGPYAVTASAAGASTTAEFALTNTADLLNLVVQPVAAVAGQAFINVVLATFTDAVPGARPSDFRAGITWGDGITTPSTTVIADGPGRFAVLGTHTYVDAGIYTFGVQVTVNGGAGASANGTATVTAPAKPEARGLVVTTYRDVVDAFDDLTSLREAIAYANGHPGPDTIVFATSAFGSRARTIALRGGPLVLTDKATTTIVGAGAGRLTIDGAGRSRVFDVRGGSLAVSRLTIAGGRADDGGGVRNDGGRHRLTDVVLRGNSARVLGGGLFNDGTAMLRDVTVVGNAAAVGGGIANTGTWTRAGVAIRRNFARFARDLFDSRPAGLARRR
jgi:hypothetical protein